MSDNSTTQSEDRKIPVNEEKKSSEVSRFNEFGIMKQLITDGKKLYYQDPVSRQIEPVPDKNTCISVRFHRTQQTIIPSHDDITNFREKGHCDTCNSETIFTVVRINDLYKHRRCLKCKQ